MEKRDLDDATETLHEILRDIAEGNSQAALARAINLRERIERRLKEKEE